MGRKAKIVTKWAVEETGNHRENGPWGDAVGQGLQVSDQLSFVDTCAFEKGWNDGYRRGLGLFVG